MTTPTNLNATLKSNDTEEWLDIVFTRPLGYLWARFFNYFNIHPNVVTVLSIFLGVAAGICFYFNELWVNILGIFLLIWANLYDSCDGQLARMTGKKTRLGRVLDGFAGDTWFYTIYAAICLRLTPQEMPFFGMKWGIWIWGLGALAGLVCHTNQSKLADYYRNIHLFFLKGKEGSELDNFQKLRKEFYELSWKDDGVWRLFLYFYGNYTRSQEQMTPRFQAFFQRLQAQFPEGNYPQTLREEFRAGSLPLMPYANILTFNTRAIALYASLLVGMPYLYFLFEILVLTALFAYMKYKHETLCEHLTAKLSSYESSL